MAYTTVNDPQKHFNTVLYTGTLVANPVVGVGFQPDLVWVKDREGTNWHSVGDSSRGINKLIYPSEVDDEYTNSGNGQLITSFDSDGFTLGTHDNQNYLARGFVSWNWKANGGTRTTFTESGNNPAGGHQANTTAGFSIVDYVGTGAAGTIAHGLGAVPHMIIVKNRTDASSWLVYHHKNTSAPETDILELQATNATYDNSTYWNDTAPTSTVFTVNTSSDLNANDKNYIAYVFTGIQGYSKFGTYVGVNSTNNTFVYTGFNPAYILVKANGGTEHWVTLDNVRNPGNVANKAFKTSDNTTERTSGYEVDFLSNGFKVRASSGQIGGNNSVYVYAAFAEAPFVTSNGAPGNAR